MALENPARNFPLDIFHLKQEMLKTPARYTAFTKAINEAMDTPVGLTPKETIWTKNKSTLHHYLPVKETLYPVPVLVVYALINKPFIMDLTPGNSFIEYLVNAGFDVYLLEWGTPADEDRHLKYDDYIYDYLDKAVTKVVKYSGSDQVTLLGYCIGGTMVTMYTALQSSAGKARVKNLVTLATPIDFSNAGPFTTWLADGTFDANKMADVIGNVPGEMIDLGNKLLKPVSNYIGTYVNLWDKVEDEQFVYGWSAMTRWINDGIPFTADCFRQWITEFYQGNKLTKGTLRLRGQRVDLAAITCPVLTIAAERDHIAHLSQTKVLNDLISSIDKEFVVMPGGHIGLVVGGSAKKGLLPKVVNWLSERSN